MMQMDNLVFFEESVNHKEELIDSSYHSFIERIIIPKTKNETNDLTQANTNVIRYISTIETMLTELKYPIEYEEITKLLIRIRNELKTTGMNYSPFCQYFNIHNINYSLFINQNESVQIELLRFLVPEYINNRHSMYLSHGYSNMVLQVMSDNYSHKRKGSYGTNIIARKLTSLGFVDLSMRNNIEIESTSKSFLLSDKTGKKAFEQFAKRNNINLSEKGMNTKKYPDALIRIGSDYFIVEQKNMKEGGGGQDKQTLEIINFINKKPEMKNLHYVTYINGVFFNSIENTTQAKASSQYSDIQETLRKHKENYFVNSYGFDILIDSMLLELNP